jgi:hypothetical protein
MLALSTTKMFYVLAFIVYRILGPLGQQWHWHSWPSGQRYQQRRWPAEWCEWLWWTNMTSTLLLPTLFFSIGIWDWKTGTMHWMINMKDVIFYVEKKRCHITDPTVQPGHHAKFCRKGRAGILRAKSCQCLVLRDTRKLNLLVWVEGGGEVSITFKFSNERPGPEGGGLNIDS